MHFTVAARENQVNCWLTRSINNEKSSILTTNYLTVCTQNSRCDNHAVTDTGTLSIFLSPLTNQRQE